MKNVPVAGVLAGGALLLVGCTGGASPVEEAVQTSATVAAPSTTAGLPDVTFDACAAIDDNLFRELGLDPTRKERDVNSFGDTDLVACHIIQPDRSISFLGQNVPWDDIPLTAPAQPMTINGREALYVPDSQTADSCALLIRTAFGAVIIDTSPRRGGPNGFTGHACDGVVQMAEAIEPLITD